MKKPCMPCAAIRRMILKNPAEAVRMLKAFRAAKRAGHSEPSVAAMNYYRSLTQ